MGVSSQTKTRVTKTFFLKHYLLFSSPYPAPHSGTVPSLSPLKQSKLNLIDESSSVCGSMGFSWLISNVRFDLMKWMSHLKDPFHLIAAALQKFFIQQNLCTVETIVTVKSRNNPITPWSNPLMPVHESILSTILSTNLFYDTSNQSMHWLMSMNFIGWGLTPSLMGTVGWTQVSQTIDRQSIKSLRWKTIDSNQLPWVRLSSIFGCSHMSILYVNLF